MPIPEHEPLPAATPASPILTAAPTPPPGKWGPYSGAADFTANMATILVALFCALILAVAANAVVRHFFRRRRSRRMLRDARLPVTGAGAGKATAGSRAAGCEAPQPPPLVFSRLGTTHMAGDGPPECAICLSEFADGDHVRVIPACNHGFHVKCVEAWLAAKPSCPICRSNVGGTSTATCTPAAAEQSRPSSTAEDRPATSSPEGRTTTEEP